MSPVLLMLSVRLLNVSGFVFPKRSSAVPVCVIEKLPLNVFPPVPVSVLLSDLVKVTEPLKIDPLKNNRPLVPVKSASNWVPLNVLEPAVLRAIEAAPPRIYYCA